MRNDHGIGELPPNYEELKKAAYRTANWRERLKAIEELGKWKNEKTIGILRRIAASDPVYRLQETAYQKLKSLGVEVPSPSKKPGELIKGSTTVLLRIKKSLPKDHTVEAFKEKLKNMRSDIYDAYEGQMGADFDQWLTSTWASLGKQNTLS